jgi:hypothetical protein
MVTPPPFADLYHPLGHWQTVFAEWANGAHKTRPDATFVQRFGCNSSGYHR